MSKCFPDPRSIPSSREDFPNARHLQACLIPTLALAGLLIAAPARSGADMITYTETVVGERVRSDGFRTFNGLNWSR